MLEVSTHDLSKPSLADWFLSMMSLPYRNKLGETASETSATDGNTSCCSTDREAVAAKLVNGP